jgi:hypothetical protein
MENGNREGRKSGISSKTEELTTEYALCSPKRGGDTRTASVQGYSIGSCQYSGAGLSSRVRSTSFRSFHLFLANQFSIAFSTSSDTFILCLIA